MILLHSSLLLVEFTMHKFHQSMHCLLCIFAFSTYYQCVTKYGAQLEHSYDAFRIGSLVTMLKLNLRPELCGSLDKKASRTSMQADSVCNYNTGLYH